MRIQETERKPESRRLELNGYLTKPTTRLGRYNLLLREILKRTPQGNPDFELIPQAMEMISRLLERVDEETGIAEKSFRLQLIDARLSFKSTNVFVVGTLLTSTKTLGLLTAEFMLGPSAPGARAAIDYARTYEAERQKSS